MLEQLIFVRLLCTLRDICLGFEIFLKQFLLFAMSLGIIFQVADLGLEIGFLLIEDA